MSDVVRLITTGELVYKLSAASSRHSYVMFPFGRESKRGHRAAIQIVRDDKLKLEKGYGYG